MRLSDRGSLVYVWQKRLLADVLNSSRMEDCIFRCVLVFSRVKEVNVCLHMLNFQRLLRSLNWPAVGGKGGTRVGVRWRQTVWVWEQLEGKEDNLS